ncbi:hypothetical protein G7046_g1694 [Stylonectria norvegica]|nr:hypothetical protein G7046_g1694 [Stylonectria norvegica]
MLRKERRRGDMPFFKLNHNPAPPSTPKPIGRLAARHRVVPHLWLMTFVDADRRGSDRRVRAWTGHHATGHQPHVSSGPLNDITTFTHGQLKEADMEREAIGVVPDNCVLLINCQGA